MDVRLRNMTSVYITYENKILMLYRQGGRVVNHVWVASAGGHFEENELNDARACVLREMEEELGITESAFKHMEMRYVTLRRTKGEIRQNYYFFAELNRQPDDGLSSNEGTLKWFDAPELHTLEMPYTAKYVMEHYLSVGKCNHKIYGGIANGRQVVFTELPDY